jgi:AraC family transcriptional regulator
VAVTDVRDSRPRHYEASRAAAGGGPLRAWGDLDRAPAALAYWRAGAVDLVDHANDAHPTLLFHAAGGRVRSEPCDRFRSAGRGWPGEALFVPTGAAVRCRWDEPVEYLHVYFRPGFVEGVAHERFGRALGELQDRSHVRDASLARVVARLVARAWPGDGAAAEAGPGGEALRLDGLAHALALTVLRTFSPLAGPPQALPVALAGARLRRVVEFVDAHLAEPLSVAALAGVAGLGPSHFAHAFRREVGCSPYRFVLARRVERAKRLLAGARDVAQDRTPDPSDDTAPGTLSLARVARAAGFGSQTHFTTAFGRLTGVTPGAWRRLHERRHRPTA